MIGYGAKNRLSVWQTCIIIAIQSFPVGEGAGPTDKLNRLKADILKALGHPTRISIVEYLRHGERCVCEIFPALRMEQSNVSQHLAVLKKSGVLESRKDGLRVIYRISSPEVLEILDLLQETIVRRARDNAAMLGQIGAGEG